MADGPVLRLPELELHTVQGRVVDVHNRVSDNRGGSVPTTRTARLQCRLAPGEAARSFAWFFDHLGTVAPFTLTTGTSTVAGEVVIDDTPVDDWIDWHVNRIDP